MTQRLAANFRSSELSGANKAARVTSAQSPALTLKIVALIPGNPPPTCPPPSHHLTTVTATLGAGLTGGPLACTLGRLPKTSNLSGAQPPQRCVCVLVLGLATGGHPLPGLSGLLAGPLGLPGARARGRPELQQWRQSASGRERQGQDPLRSRPANQMAGASQIKYHTWPVAAPRMAILERWAPFTSQPVRSVVSPCLRLTAYQSASICIPSSPPPPVPGTDQRGKEKPARKHPDIHR
ncbi:hypothetical protein F5X68DRAFT_79590 [Plectosphaerella plurivora]|uniref:Uncharacterized protein n=1 Tax=Plectosphaerella plurivora TaxID=936078 RepID=A0A9P9AB46_9PEZI|nr:hypothetical protein F5X68DRAFT_79590 [Plectosphaerella plurivora]